MNEFFKGPIPDHMIAEKATPGMYTYMGDVLAYIPQEYAGENNQGCKSATVEDGYSIVIEFENDILNVSGIFWMKAFLEDGRCAVAGAIMLPTYAFIRIIEDLLPAKQIWAKVAGAAEAILFPNAVITIPDEMRRSLEDGQIAFVQFEASDDPTVKKTSG